jgi:hypothetical protein
MQELIRQAGPQSSVVPPPPANWAQQQLESWARGGGDIPKPAGTTAQPSMPQAAPTTAKGPSPTAPPTPGLANAFVLSPTLTEHRTISAPIPPPAPLSTFICGSPPNQYPCPVSFDAPKATAPPPSTPDNDLGPFAPSGGSTKVVPHAVTRQLTPRQEEHARREQQRRVEEADAALAKLAKDGFKGVPKLSCKRSCLTTKGTTGQWCQWCVEKTGIDACSEPVCQ